MIIFIYLLLLIAITLVGGFVLYLNKRQSNVSKLRLDALEKKISASGEGKRKNLQKEKQSFFKSFTYNFIDQLKFLGIEIEEKQVVLLLGIAYFSIFLIAFIVTKNIVIALVLGSIGIILPKMVVKNKIAKRQKAFINLFGDTLSLMANTLKSGFGFRQALQLIADEMPSPICDEFSKLTQEISWGLSLTDAMENFSKRIPDENVKLFTTAIIIQNEVGGSLADIIGKISLAIKVSENAKKELKVLLSQGKMSGYVIEAMPFILGVLFFVMNAEYISLLWSGTMGYILLGAALFNEGLGVFMISKITTIK